jgi:hypothetical protein
MNIFGHNLPIPDNESFDKARQFLIDCPPASSNKEVLRRFITKYGGRINAETTAFTLAVLFEGVNRNNKN